MNFKSKRGPNEKSYINESTEYMSSKTDVKIYDIYYKWTP